MQNFIRFRLKTVENAKIDKNNPLQPRVRVTVIDTGIDPHHDYIKKRKWNLDPQVERFRDFVEPVLDDERKDGKGNPFHKPIDKDGHGTFIAGILLQLVPDIDLRVARIGVNRDGIRKDSNLPSKVSQVSQVNGSAQHKTPSSLPMC
jgi:subtilisin family serine protease